MAKIEFRDHSSFRKGPKPPGPVLPLKAHERIDRQTGARDVEHPWRRGAGDAEITGRFRVYRRRVGPPGWVLAQRARINHRAAVLRASAVDVVYEFVVRAVSDGGLLSRPTMPPCSS